MEARLQDRLTASFVRELDRALADLNKRTRRILLQLETAKPDQRLVASQANLARALQIRKEIREAFAAAGYSELATASVDKPLDDMTASVLRGRGREAAKLTAGQVNTLVALKEMRLADLFEIQDDAERVLQRAVLDGVLGSRPVADLVDDLEDALGVSSRQARTIYDTSVSTFTRTVHTLHTTGEPDELFFYAGPADGATRHFCRERVGRVFTRKQISEMSNGQLPNVLLTAGGYNCRHVLEPVSDIDEELQKLAETGERLPSIETEMKEAA